VSSASRDTILGWTKSWVPRLLLEFQFNERIWRAQDSRSVQMLSAVAGALLAMSILGGFSIGLAVLPGATVYGLTVGVLSAQYCVGRWSLLCAVAGAVGQAIVMLDPGRTTMISRWNGPRRSPENILCKDYLSGRFPQLLFSSC
jgi:hypothetical protein